MSAEERLAEFKADLGHLAALAIIQKHIYVGSSFILPDGKYAALRTEISGHFSIHATEVIMVGSAKLGFSVKPNRRYGHFNDGSDIDIAIKFQSGVGPTQAADPES